MVTDPLLTAREAAALLCEHGIKTHEKTLKSYAQSGDIRAQRDRRPGTKNIKKAKWLFRKSSLLEDFGAMRVHNRETQYHEMLANGGFLAGYQ